MMPGYTKPARRRSGPEQEFEGGPSSVGAEKGTGALTVSGTVIVS